MSGCPTGKQSHPTEQAAETAARLVGERKGKRLVGYRCDRCSGWHAGTPKVPAGRPFPRPRVAVPDDAKGTVYCADPPAGCGHRADLHVGGVCLGRRGSCPCRLLTAR